MQPGVLRTLEFDRIVEVVRTLALTPMGAARLARLAPSTDPETVAALLADTSEMVRYLDSGAPFPLGAPAEIEDVLTALAVEGRALEPLQLLALAGFLEAIEEVRAAIDRAPGSFPRLQAAARPIASFRRETALVRDQIEPTGEVADRASADLKLIRDRLRKQRARLRGMLESFLRGRDTAKYLQEQVVTERNGRYVLVVRAEHRHAIAGIVHGTSASGASLFLEPLSTVEINNDIVALEEQEREEIRRILLALADAFRRRAADLQRTVAAAAELDVVQARARFSALVGGIEPRLSADGALDLRAARHPLLIASVAARLPGAVPTAAPAPGGGRSGPVPVDLRILPPSTCLLITGPNTGGKTVALKTAGLLALMAQAGLHVPAAEGSRLPVFRSVFADIGDEQSIDASLSTFSAHVAHLAAMDRELQVPALVLLDEVGSGTDPIEGGALGVAVVDHFRARGAMVVATSHFDALKTYASTTEGVTVAAFGFDAETFAPTYRLVYGSAGRSLALEIAARLGLNPSIIASARQNLSAREAQLAEHLAKIDRDMRALEHEQRLAARERQTLEAAEARLRQREDALRQREDEFRARVAEAVAAEVRQARRQIDEVVAQLKAKADAMAVDPRRALSTGLAAAARAEARAAVDRIAGALIEPPAPPPAAEGRPPAVGDRVLVAGLGLEAVVTGLHDGTADLEVRGKRMRASVRDLRVTGTSPPAAAPTVSVHVQLQPRDAAVTDLNVIGCTVDEAIARAERFLDESLLGDQRIVRVIHGYGTGQLKRALAGFLQQHPLVARFAAAPPEQGGGGVTVVELKD